MLKDDKQDLNNYLISFDLQQQIGLPRLTHSKMYYSRQLSCYNLGIHDERREKGVMCLWSEDFGGRGSIEIATSLYDYLTQEICKGSTTKLILWSDNCAGQNKNQFIIAMYFVLIAKGYFDEVIHKFLVKGHTYMSCDRDFGLIEKMKKSKLLVLKDVAKMIGAAAIKNPFEIMMKKNFVNWKSIATTAFKTYNDMHISEVVQIKMNKTNFGEVQVSYSFNNDWVP